MERGKQLVNGRGATLAVQIIFVNAAAGCQHTGDIQQLTGVEHAAVVGAVERLRHIFHTGKRGTAVKAQPLFGRIGLALKLQHFFHIGAGHKAQAPLFGRVADGAVAEHFQHRRQFQRADRFFKHFAHK